MRYGGPLRYPRVIVNMSSSQWRTLKRYHAYVGIKLRSALFGGFISEFSSYATEKHYHLNKQWLWHVFSQIEVSSAQTPRFCGSARLSRCIRTLSKGPHAVQRSIFFLIEKSFSSVSVHSIHLS